MKLKSIAEETRDCRKAFKNSKVGDPVWLCHHEILAEVLTQDAEARISFILNVKPYDERALRLRLFRPIDVSTLPKKVQKAWAVFLKTSVEHYSSWDEYDKAWEKYAETRDEFFKLVAPYYRTLFPDSPWNGKTIFSKR